jgi:hypothetical protein
VDLPAPFGPRRPKISPLDAETDAVDGGEGAEHLLDVLNRDAGHHCTDKQHVDVMPTARRRSLLSTRSAFRTCGCRAWCGSRRAAWRTTRRHADRRRFPPFVTGGEPHGERVADTHAIDVGLLDVGAAPSSRPG